MRSLLLGFESILTRWFSLVLIASLGVGLIFPALCNALAPFIMPLLMIVIYLGFLKTDISILLREFRNLKRLVWINLFCLILIPSFLFLLVKTLEQPLALNHAWATGVLLLFACPVAAMGPTLALVMHGHFERTLCALILTTLIAPFTLPLLLSIWVGASLDVEIWAMTLFLVQLILLPFVAAQITFHFFKPVQRKLTPHTASLSVLFLGLVVIGAISGLSETLYEHPRLLVEGVTVASGCMLLAYIIGWCFHFPAADLKDRSTLAILATWSNIGLSIVFAKQFFPDSDILLFVILAEIPWNIGFAPAQAFVKRKTAHLP